MSITPSLARSWAWLVGIPDEGEFGFLCCDHDLAISSGQWHSLRPDGRVTVCGMPVPYDAEHTRALYTVCDSCGLELAKAGRAFHAPWAIVTDVVYAHHRGGPTSALEGAAL